ncbi:GAF domain-containing protein [Bifidobacterium sp. ESL0775]|uniref:GAF domain-containing protein n=1 Tax=Bifidobacterium sp. ESL0775 TaxID=2983230 RepID=UPI0023F70429|nr:GAF domain-containing protein [Bifidobacterium sp. ESL0775]WEV69456.1 GAF domain-containing protein [Bifidobacterium sp. ESL0775]
MIHPILYINAQITNYANKQKAEGLLHITKLQRKAKHYSAGFTCFAGICSVSLAFIPLLPFTLKQQLVAGIVLALLSIFALGMIWLSSLVDDALNEVGETLEDRPLLLYSIITYCVTNLVRQLNQGFFGNPKEAFSMKQFCTSCVTSLWGALRSSTTSPRATIYRVRHPKRHMAYLEPFATFGRNESIPKPFRKDQNGRGTAVLQWLSDLKANADTLQDQNGISRFAFDVHKDKQFKGITNGYTTYISSAIIYNRQIYGMLTVDTNKSGDFLQNDCRTIEAVAHILSLAIALDITHGNNDHESL